MASEQNGAPGTTLGHASGSRPSLEFWLTFILLVATTLRSYAFVLSPSSFFIADDWGHLHRSEFIPFGPAWLPLLPSRLYNDRPVGWLLIKVMYELVGIERWPYAVLEIALHLANALLVWGIAADLLRNRTLGIIPAVLFANNVFAGSCVGWVAAIFDLAGTTLALTSWYLFQRRGPWSRISSAFFYFLAMRSKESFIGLPVILWLSLLLRRECREASNRSLRTAWGHFGVLLVFAVAYAGLYFTGPAISSSDRYFLSVAPLPFLKNVGFYTLHGLFADVFIGDTGLLRSGLLWITGAVALLLLGLCSWLGGARVAAWGFGFVVALGPVAFLPNVRDTLYLYFPSVLLDLAVATAMDDLLLKARRSTRTCLVVGRTLVAASFVWACAIPATAAARNVRNFYLVETERLARQWSSLQRVTSSLPSGSLLVVLNARPYWNVLSYGPGYAVQILRRDRSIKTILELDDSALRRRFDAATAPKMLLRFHGDDLEIVERAFGHMD